MPENNFLFCIFFQIQVWEEFKILKKLGLLVGFGGVDMMNSFPDT